MHNLEESHLQQEKETNEYKEQLNFEFTEKDLKETFKKCFLASKADNFSVYRIENIIKKNKNSLVLKAMSKIDDTKKIVTLYSKMPLFESLKAERFMKDIFFTQNLAENHIAIYYNKDFIFSVENYREFLSLFDFIKAKKSFNEKTMKFIFYEIICSLKDMHSKSLVHLNISPSAVGIDDEGFIYLKSFKFVYDYIAQNEDEAYEWVHERHKNWVFVAPEIIYGDLPDPGCDFYALGILFYYLLLKELPFTGNSMFEYKDTLQSSIFKINKNQIPSGWSLEAVDFINRLIIKEKKLRLGAFGGYNELFSHVWFTNYEKEYLKIKQSKISPIFIFLSETKKLEDNDEDLIEFAEENVEVEVEIDCEKSLMEFFDSLKKETEDEKLFYESYSDLFDN